jgi:hypothetical protein
MEHEGIRVEPNRARQVVNVLDASRVVRYVVITLAIIGSRKEN